MLVCFLHFSGINDRIFQRDACGFVNQRSASTSAKDLEGIDVAERVALAWHRLACLPMRRMQAVRAVRLIGMVDQHPHECGPANRDGSSDGGHHRLRQCAAFSL
jgi:hypothetical protein